MCRSSGPTPGCRSAWSWWAATVAGMAWSGWPASWKPPSRGRTALPTSVADLYVAERADDVLCRSALCLPVRRPRPQIGAVRVFQLDRSPADRRGHLVDLGIAQRRYVVEHPGEIVRQTAGIPARKCPGDNGRVELRMPKRRAVRGVGAGLVGEQQRGPDLGGHRSPAQHGGDILGAAEATGRDQRDVMGPPDAMQQFSK